MRSSKKKCCKLCRQVKFKGTMTPYTRFGINLYHTCTLNKKPTVLHDANYFFHEDRERISHRIIKKIQLKHLYESYCIPISAFFE